MSKSLRGRADKPQRKSVYFFVGVGRVPGMALPPISCTRHTCKACGDSFHVHHFGRLSPVGTITAAEIGAWLDVVERDCVLEMTRMVGEHAKVCASGAQDGDA